MFGFGHEEHEQVWSGEQPHESSWSHELVGGAAGFGAMKMWEDKQRRDGKPVSHAFAKEAIAGIAAGEVDKIFETKGLDFLDREKAKRHAKDQAMYQYEQHYGGHEQWHPDTPPPNAYRPDYY